jgi:hypothetical protein
MTDYRWLREAPTGVPVVLSRWDGVANIVLFPIRTGALLWWTFEDDESEALGVFVHLTSDEAQQVYDGDGGLLEPVRKHLRDRHAVVWSKKSSDHPMTGPFVIESDLSEADFAERLWAAAEATRDGGEWIPEAMHAFRLLSFA